MLEAQVASLQAQLSAQSLGDEGRGVGVGGADAEPAAAVGPERDETADAAPGEEEIVEAAPTEEEMVEAAPGEEGEIIPAMDTDSEAEAIRRCRLERFGATP